MMQIVESDQESREKLFKSLRDVTCAQHIATEVSKICLDPICLKSPKRAFLCTDCYDKHQPLHNSKTCYLDFSMAFDEKLYSLLNRLEKLSQNSFGDEIVNKTTEKFENFQSTVLQMLERSKEKINSLLLELSNSANTELKKLKQNLDKATFKVLEQNFRSLDDLQLSDYCNDIKQIHESVVQNKGDIENWSNQLAVLQKAFDDSFETKFKDIEVFLKQQEENAKVIMRYHKGDIWKPKQAKPANMMDISIALPILPVIPKQPELLKENLIRKRKPEEDHAQLEGVSGDLSKKLKISNEFGIPMKVAELNKPDNRIIPKATGDLLTVITDTELITKQLVMLGYPISTVLPTFRSKLVRKASYDILQMLVKALDERKSRDTVISLSTEFYKNIFGWEKCEEIFIIDTKEKIKRKTEMVRAFGDFQNIETLLQGIEEKSTLHILNKLKCKITPLQVNSPSDKILFNYLNNTQDSTQKKYFLKLIEAFEISRESDKEKNLKNVGNSMLLWHGTKLFNLVSLLTEGLTMPSPEIPELCYSFGRGIYFHDMASKAAEFCVKDPGDNQSYLLLYEVALGNINQLHHVYVIPPVLPKHCNSIKVFGHTAPPKKSYITIDENIQVPLGKPETVNIPNSSQQHNEYIVYDDKQIRLKYLLRVKLEPY